MFSIDQNCHSLWDVLPKLQALSRRGVSLTHFVEDIDVAFTSLGSGLDQADLRLARERFHHSGGADWGAALYYSEFLGRLPVDVRDWEPLTGMKTGVLARQLGRTVQDLFDEFSPSDNWQLIGSSYVGDQAHHRVIGDLSVAEAAGFLREVLAKAKADMLRAFPARQSQQRLLEWFAREEQLVETLLESHARGSLPELYRAWLEAYLGDSVKLAAASELFALGASAARAGMLEVFLAHYDQAAGLYNEAVAESAAKLRPLKTHEGELPFFAVLIHQGRRVRTGLWLRGTHLLVGDRPFQLAPAARLLPPGRQGRLPMEALTAAGVKCLAGKAAVLVLQACLQDGGEPLAMPYRGSLYTPVSRLLAAKLAKHGLLPAQLHPLVRVRFHLLDRMKSLDTPIRLPEHLAACFGQDEIPARRLGENYASLAAKAVRRLEMLTDPAGRKQWQEQTFPRLARDLAELEKRRRELARTAPKSEEIRNLWKQAKARQNELLAGTLRQIARDVQLRDMDYWDSRGALLPWAIALAGQSFYDELISQAEVYEEPFCQEDDLGQARPHPALL